MSMPSQSSNLMSQRGVLREKTLHCGTESSIDGQQDFNIGINALYMENVMQKATHYGLIYVI